MFILHNLGISTWKSEKNLLLVAAMLATIIYMYVVVLVVVTALLGTEWLAKSTINDVGLPQINWTYALT